MSISKHRCWGPVAVELLDRHREDLVGVPPVICTSQVIGECQSLEFRLQSFAFADVSGDAEDLTTRPSAVELRLDFQFAGRDGAVLAVVLLLTAKGGEFGLGLDRSEQRLVVRGDTGDRPSRVNLVEGLRGGLPGVMPRTRCTEGLTYVTVPSRLMVQITSQAFSASIR